MSALAKRFNIYPTDYLDDFAQRKGLFLCECDVLEAVKHAVSTYDAREKVLREAHSFLVALHADHDRGPDEVECCVGLLASIEAALAVRP